MALGRHVVVAQALRHVQQAFPRHVELGKCRVEGVEMVWGRLIGADVLGSDDLVERNAEANVAAGESSRCTSETMINL